MPSKRAALEWLQYEVKSGRGEQKCHIVDVERDQAERIKNERKVTKFVLETKDPGICSELHSEWDRVMRRVGNKSIALSLCVRAWRDALADSELDKLMAALDAPEAT